MRSTAPSCPGVEELKQPGTTVVGEDEKVLRAEKMFEEPNPHVMLLFPDTQRCAGTANGGAAEAACQRARRFAAIKVMRDKAGLCVLC